MKKKIENAFRLTLIDRIEPKKTMTNRLLPLSGRCAHTHTHAHTFQTIGQTMYIFVWIYNNCKLYGILACTEKRNTLNYSLFKTAHFVKLKKNRNKNRQNEPNDLNASKKTSIKEEHSNSRAVKCQNKSENISVNNTWYAYKITENHYGLETWSFPDNKKKKQPHAHTHANNGLRFFFLRCDPSRLWNLIYVMCFCVRHTIAPLLICSLRSPRYNVLYFSVTYKSKRWWG